MQMRKGRRSPLLILPRIQSQATRKTEFKSEMITLINKYGDQPMSSEDRDSYYEDFETNNLPIG